MSFTGGDSAGLMGEGFEPGDPRAYKRAVYRPPPKNFYVGMLPPVKQGNQYSYGIRIYPVIASKRSSRSSRSSVSSGSSTDSNDREYDIWRRWEDCLHFQETLEIEYSRMAREKRARLLAGKGVKSKGMYLQNQPGSFESLPAGPEPDSIALDIHAILPRLNHKTGLFQTASNMTAAIRAKQLSRLIEAIFQEDVPTLVAELRTERLVTDFFGFWRRDFDLSVKEEKASGVSPRSRESMALSLSSTAYFSTESPSEDAQRLSGGLKPTSSSSLTPSFFRKRSIRKESSERRSTVSDSSRSSSDGASTIRPRSSTDASINSVDSVPLVFGHNPDEHQPHHSRPISALTSSDEGHDSKSVQGHGPLPNRRHRESSVYMSHSANRDSWQTMTSISDVLEGLDLELNHETPEEHSIPRRNRDSVASFATFQTTDSADAIIPWSSSHVAGSMVYRPQRDSVASFATFMTDCSADAIIPGGGAGSHVGRRTSASSMRTVRNSTRPDSVAESDWSDDGESMIDFDSFPMPFSYIPESPEAHETDSEEDGSMPSTPVARTAPRLPSITILPSFSFRPSIYGGRRSSSRASTVSSSVSSDFSDYSHTSAANSVSSASTSPTLDESDLCEDEFDAPFVVPVLLTVKAVLNDTIVVLRMADTTGYDELRQRLRVRFTQQENVPLSTSFTISLISPSFGRARSSSVSSVDSVRSTNTQLKPIASQEQWQEVTELTHAFKGKLTLLVVDTTLNS